MATPWRHSSVADSRRDYDEYGNEVGEWLGHLADWQWFVTCTLRDPTSGRFDQAGSGQARACLRALLVESKCSSYVCVFELQRRGATHLHALLAGCPGIAAGVANDYFFERFGISRWKVFKPDGAAPKYIGKYLTKDVVEMYIQSSGPYEYEDFKVLTGGLTKKGTLRYTWDTTMKGARV